MSDSLPRQHPSRAFRELIFSRSDGHCEHQGCGRPITLETFHVAHVRSHAHGGPLHKSNVEAWCPPCNLTWGARDAGDSRVIPRQWQRDALDKALTAIMRSGAATVAAAPGAGKTVLAALVYEALRELDLVDRMAVFVPRTALVDQWALKLVSQRHIELKKNSAIERRGQHGVVNTYQSLGNSDALDAHLREAERTRLLLVLDEVHHIGERPGGERPPWAKNVCQLAGDVAAHDLNVTAILNLSGTLWRSRQDEKISTVIYRTLDDNRLESWVDFTVSVEELVHRGELRPLDLYRLGAQVRLADYQTLEHVEGDLSDLDERPARTALSSLSSIALWRTAFVASVLDRLEAAWKALDGYYVKALIVAHRIEAARMLRDEVDRQMQERGLRSLAELAVSGDDVDGRKVLEDFRKQKKPGVLCTVDMAGEGYDCPEIAVIGWASNKLTSMYVRQVTARAMRVTDRERELGFVIPAAVIIPDVQELVDQLVSYLAPYTHEVLVPKPEDLIRQRGEEPVEGGGTLAFPRYVLEEAQPGTDHTVTVPYGDGSREDIDAEVARRYAEELARLNVPGIFAARAIAAGRRTVGDLLASKPFERPGRDVVVLEKLANGAQAIADAGITRSSSIEEQAGMLQRQIDRWAGWWQMNGDSPASHFNTTVNGQAGIAKGKRPTASVEQLMRARDAARKHITAYCERTGIKPPRGMETP